MSSSRRATIRRTPRAAAKSKTHSRITTAAGRLIRKKGLAAASVHEVMHAAGLTVGGFYAHFRSKTAMEAEVLSETLAEARQEWLKDIDHTRPREWVAEVVKRYLNPLHRDRPQEGCPLPAVLSELARAGRETRGAVAEGFENYVKEFSAFAPRMEGVTPRERALATLALCVGGVAIARALHGYPIGDETLQACVKWALPEREKKSNPGKR